MRISLFILMTLFTLPAFASDIEDIQKIETYLQNLHQAKANFVQTAPNGAQMTGTFYLNRPGKLRFEYDPPVKDFVVADGTFIYFYDSELGEQSNAPIGQTLADFILRKNIKLSGDLVVNELNRSAGLLQVQVSQAADPYAGNIRLGFTENPFQLKKWRVTDAQGGITEVVLNNLNTNVSLDRDLFYYYDPKRKTPRYNR